MIMDDLDAKSKKASLRNDGGQSLSGVTILNLENNMCRYIVDAPLYADTYYCGDPKERGVYCAAHAEMCYYGPKRKRPDNAHDNPAQSDTAV